MSLVFLTDRYAWKLKKPVREAYLDFSTLESRRADCEAEVRLNRRLAPDVYLGAVPLTLDAAGRMQLGGQGEVIDWLVHMRRLPEARMLDVLIATRSVDPAGADQLGRRLAAFYRQADRRPLPPIDYCERLAADLDASAQELRLPQYGLPLDAVDWVHSQARAVLEQQAGAVGSRGAQLVDAHGDLRPEHVCLCPEPVIIDCLEFSADFRLLDPVSELAYLALECARLGAGWVGERILRVYQATTGDAPPPWLVAFYKRQHALTRAKIAVWHLRDAGQPERTSWIAKAGDYLRCARSL
jgi:aminoglycoside phosphotransferase family enzyme